MRDLYLYESCSIFSVHGLNKVLLHTSALVAVRYATRFMWLGAMWGSNAGALREDEGGSQRLSRHWVLVGTEARRILEDRCQSYRIFRRDQTVASCE